MATWWWRTAKSSPFAPTERLGLVLLAVTDVTGPLECDRQMIDRLLSFASTLKTLSMGSLSDTWDESRIFRNVLSGPPHQEPRIPTNRSFTVQQSKNNLLHNPNLFKYAESNVFHSRVRNSNPNSANMLDFVSILSIKWMNWAAAGPWWSYLLGDRSFTKFLLDVD